MKKLLQSKRFQASVGLAVSLGAIIWLYLSVEWSKVWLAMQLMRWWYLVPATALLVLQLWVRGMRWRKLLLEGERLPVRNFFDLIMIGNFATNLLPLRAGEFVRPIVLSKQLNVSFSTCFVSIVIERFFDLSLVLLSFATMVRFIPGIPKIAHDGAFALSVLAVGIFAVMIIGSIFPLQLLKVFDFCTAVLPEKLRVSGRNFFRDFLSGAAVLKDARRLSEVVCYSLIVWLSTYAVYYVFLLSLGLPDSIWLAVSVTVIIALAVAAPSAPGFVGVYQIACVASFALFAIEREPAVAYALITHAFQYLVTILYGAFALSRMKLSFADLRRASQQDHDASNSARGIL